VQTGFDDRISHKETSFPEFPPPLSQQVWTSWEFSFRSRPVGSAECAWIEDMIWAVEESKRRSWPSDVRVAPGGDEEPARKVKEGGGVAREEDFPRPDRGDHGPGRIVLNGLWRSGD
jgi:hypothetical protein